MYIVGLKYADLVELNVVVIEIRGVENDMLAVPVSTCNALACHTAFLATDTQSSVLITYIFLINLFSYMYMCISRLATYIHIMLMMILKSNIYIYIYIYRISRLFTQGANFCFFRKARQSRKNSFL